MTNHYYGNNGYNASKRIQPEKPKTQFKWPKVKLPKFGKSKKPKWKQVLHWALAVFVAGLFIAWL
ncbi:MAG: hypothetical protein ACI9QC_000142, partial [Oceanicoccus sp.]